MVQYSNSVIATRINEAEYTGRVAAAHARPVYGVTSLRVDDPLVFQPFRLVPDATRDTGGPIAVTSVSYDNGLVADTMGGLWWDLFHVLPREVVLGNVLSNQQIGFEVYSAFRRDDHTWNSFVNNAGVGVEMTNLPTLPFTFKPQSSGGLNLILLVSTSGDPKVEDTLDFIFDVSTISVLVSLERVVLLPLPPELPYDETLQFLTDVLVHKDATEQRIALRKNPRQLFTWNLILEDGVERAKIHNFLYDWQSRIFGVPQWHELTTLTAAASITDTVVTVQSTAFADYRTDVTKGDLVLVYTDENTFDVLPLLSLTATTLTFESGVLNNHAIGAIVCPLRTGVLTDRISGSRFPSADAKLKLNFRILDNDANLADTTAFSTYNSKVLIDDLNGVRGSMKEAFEQEIVVTDGETGVTVQSSPWSHNRRVSRKSFLAAGKQGLWEVRQLLHALRGQQISYYIPSFSNDFIPTATLSSGSTLLNVSNVGYTKSVQSRPGRNIIRVTFNNGDPALIRVVTGSSVISATEEQLTLDDTWPNTVTVSEVDRVEYIEKARFDTDTFKIRHEVGSRLAYVSADVVAVVE